MMVFIRKSRLNIQTFMNLIKEKIRLIYKEYLHNDYVKVRKHIIVMDIRTTLFKKIYPNVDIIYNFIEFHVKNPYARENILT